MGVLCDSCVTRCVTDARLGRRCPYCRRTIRLAAKVFPDSHVAPPTQAAPPAEQQAPTQTAQPLLLQLLQAQADNSFSVVYVPFLHAVLGGADAGQYAGAMAGWAAHDVQWQQLVNSYCADFAASPVLAPLLQPGAVRAINEPLHDAGTHGA